MFYTSKDVLEILKISKPTLYKLCKQKNIKPKTISGHFRFSDEDLSILVSDNKKEYDDKKEFEGLVEEIMFVLNKFSKKIYGIKGEDILKTMILKTRMKKFILNKTVFKGKNNE